MKVTLSNIIYALGEIKVLKDRYSDYENEELNSKFDDAEELLLKALKASESINYILKSFE